MFSVGLSVQENHISSSPELNQLFMAQYFHLSKYKFSHLYCCHCAFGFTLCWHTLNNMPVFCRRHGPSLSAWPWRVQWGIWSGHSSSIASPRWSSLACRVPLPVPDSPFPSGCSSQLLWSRWRQCRQPAQWRSVTSSHTASYIEIKSLLWYGSVQFFKSCRLRCSK